MRADLHIHTIYSDGKHAPAEVARLAKEAGVGLISMTDHDNLEGLEEKRQAAANEGLYYVSGWEVSSYAAIGKVHVLGYGCNTNEHYRAFMNERVEGSYIRAHDIIKKANAYFNLSVTIDDCEREHPKSQTPIHTMHIIRAYSRILNSGKNALKMRLGDLYLSFFAEGKPAYSNLCRPTPFDAIKVIHASGGIAVMAHPGRIRDKFQEREALMDELCAAGLDGLECTYTTHSEEETAYFKSYAAAHGLLRTGGSDFHYLNARRIIGSPEFHPDEALLKALRL